MKSLSVPLLLFTFQVCFVIAGAIEYVKCKQKIGAHYAVCDCTEIDECKINLTITRNKSAVPDGEDTSNLYNFNGMKMGPTLIVNLNTYVLVDVFNKLEENDTSFHWHGMHQRSTGYMDGVANVTQKPIGPGETFRLVSKDICNENYL